MKEALKLELEAWKNAAIRLGEELSSVGPDGYYDMTAQQWLDWAMEQEPRGKNSLAQPEQEPVGTVAVNDWIEMERAVGYRDGYEAALKQVTQPEQKPVEDVVAYHSDGTRTVRIAPKRPWVGLTDEQIWKFWSSRPEVLDGEDDGMEAEFVAAVRRVLAAHDIGAKP